MIVLGVALGGALGALCRYYASLMLLPALQGTALAGYPLATVLVNVSGSFLLSLLLFQELFTIPPALRAAVGTGFIGSFTTFSTFEFESDLLIRRDGWGIASTYIFANLLLGYMAILLGRWLVLRFN
ncbi:MAG: fluoride efflux transporter CrcB [Trueperaceae bacterium]|nr:MAG: fluoride efflux transporter CrcB [Trueperaceae bacterium]